MAQFEPANNSEALGEIFWLRLKCQCGARLKAPPRAAGRTLDCPGCGVAVACPRDLLPLKSLPSPEFGRATSQQLSAARAIVTATKFNIDLLTAADRPHELESFRRDALRELRRLHGMIDSEVVEALPPCPLECLALATHPSPPSTRWVSPDRTQDTVEVAKERIREMIQEVKIYGTDESIDQRFRQKPR